ncbi:MAG: hypothetical protein RLY67_869 [Pseudomonadota bacterium]
MRPASLTQWCRAAQAGRFPVWSPEVLADRRERLANVSAFRPASVLIGLRPSAEGFKLVLTQRLGSLMHHPGQISLPGGAAEASDSDPAFTAIREAHEEIGLEPQQVEALHCLPIYQTVSGFSVTPVIGMVSAQARYRPNPAEVDEVFEVPLSFLMNPVNHQRRGLRIESEPIEFFAMPYEGRFIWGATAAMVRNLYHFLFAAWSQHKA